MTRASVAERLVSAAWETTGALSRTVVQGLNWLSGQGHLLWWHTRLRSLGRADVCAARGTWPEKSRGCDGNGVSMRITHLAMALALVGFAARAAHAAETLMYVNDSANRLLTVDVSTGHAERLGTTGAQLTDIAFNEQGQLYGISPTFLYQIDPANGWSTLIGPLGFGAAGQAYGLDALTFTSDGTLYAAGNDVLVRIDTTTGTGTKAGNLSTFRSAGDLTTDTAGRLLLTTDVGLLVEVDRNGSGATAVGSLPYSDIFGFGCNAGGMLYGIRATNEIVLVDSATGQSTVTAELQGDFLLGYAWGGGFPGHTAPEPSSLVVWVTGALWCLRRWRPLCRTS